MKKIFVIFTVITVAVVALASLFASASPDGLEWVAGKLGFLNVAIESPLKAAMPDYAVAGISSPFWSSFLAGISGIGIISAVFFLINLIYILFVNKKAGGHIGPPLRK